VTKVITSSRKDGPPAQPSPQLPLQKYSLLSGEITQIHQKGTFCFDKRNSEEGCIDVGLDI
jgi:hypothetical protein